jgi:S-DNA-T family DNA segregation ATPase FtsK/SpoIIIE
MARRKKRRQEEEEEQPIVEMNPETKRGIAVVGLFAGAAILFLSFFHIAGSLGVWIDGGFSQFFGFDRFLIPVILILVGATLLYPERGQFSIWNYLGFFFFFLSFNALINLMLVNRPDPAISDPSMAGGYLGQFLGVLLPNIVGFWGAIVITTALFAVAVMLIFNTSLRSMMGLHTHLTGWFGAKLHNETGRKENPYETDEEADEEQPVEEEDEEEPEEEEEEEEKPFKAAMVANHQELPEEKALTTRRQRQVIIPLDLLDYRANNANSGDIDRNKEIIQKTLEQFGISVEMADVATGPTVTQYTLRPAQGVKLARIVGLQNDLALALAAHPIRIEAPIPGKSLVGIEVPNQTIATVSLREMLEAKAFQKRPTNLSVPLGKDVAGGTWVVPLDKMPHMLVAGATGSGKSVCLNTMIVSLLYENGPDDLKFIMVDPKRVELNAYEGIPHLLVPPIMKAEDTVNALKWTVREMERRLDVLSKFGARDIGSYNERAEEKMPKIVVIIDELADLMTSSGREVEASIVRVAQMARAVGIHLVLATQRPSVDVITGLIKANVPARIAFAVASQTDSRTILDMQGAEKLLGRGDMLFTSAELSKPKRLQGAYISDDEIRKVVAFLKKEGAPDYNYAITEHVRTGTVLDSGTDEEPLLDEAAHVIIQSGKASTSLLQRRLKVGYARAARIMDILEDKGVIGPGDGAKPREVLVEEWPPGGEVTEAMPTAQDDYDEAAEDAGDEEDESSDEEAEDGEEEADEEVAEDGENEQDDDEEENT